MPRPWRDFTPALLLLAGSALLALLLRLEWQHDLQRRAAAAATPAPALPAPTTETDAAALELQPLETYAQIIERPLFQEHRRPLPAEEPSDTHASEQTPLDLKLMGLVQALDGKTALFVDAHGKYQRVRLGGTIRGWKLSDISTDRVTLEQAGVVRELLLRKPKPAPSAHQSRGTPPEPGASGPPPAQPPPNPFAKAADAQPGENPFAQPPHPVVNEEETAPDEPNEE